MRSGECAREWQAEVFVSGLRTSELMRRQKAVQWLLLAGTVLACQEKLTSPADCPALCPGGQLQVIDTVLTALPGGDSTYVGYVARGSGNSLRVSSQLPASEDRAVIRFIPRPDSVSVSGTLQAYTIDSVALAFSLLARDTLVSGLKLFLYRLPVSVDSNTTFADVDPLLVPANLVDSIVVDDTLKRGRLRAVVDGADLSRVALPAADSGVLALGIRIEAVSPTGVRLGSLASGSTLPEFITYVHADVADPSLQQQLIRRTPAFNTFVSQSTPALDPNLLIVGDAPAARAIVRFALPAHLRDSATIVRATLELIPASPLFGLPNDSVLVVARGVVADIGSKSPLLSSPTPAVALVEGSSDTVRVDLVSLVQAWQGSIGLDNSLFVMIAPEASSFSRPVFHSTRSGGGSPRLRISYLPQFSFEGP